MKRRELEFFKKRPYEPDRVTLVSWHKKNSLTWRFLLDFSKAKQKGIFYHYKTNLNRYHNWGIRLFGYELAYSSQPHMIEEVYQ